MGETPGAKDKIEARDAAAHPLADASAKLIADQAAVMTMMTAVGVNLATQMAGFFMGAVANAWEKQAQAQPVEQANRQNVVPLKVVKATQPAKADDLKRISGIGPKLEKVLNGMGITTLGQIAQWDDAEMLNIDDKLGLDKRIIRDGWVKQAKALLEG